MNKKKEIDKLARLTILANFVSSKLKEQKDLVKSFITEEDKVLKGIDHKLNVIIREYERFDSESFRKEQPEVYKSYKTKLVFFFAHAGAICVVGILTFKLFLVAESAQEKWNVSN